MKIRHLYSFFADVYDSFRSRALFLSKITLFAIFVNAEVFVVLTTNINQQTTVRLQLNTKQPYIVSLSTNKNNKATFVCNKKQNGNTLFRMKLTFKQPR